MPAPKAGNIVRASNYPKVRIVTKAAVETVTNSVVLQDDNDMTIALDANKTYRVTLRLACTGPAAADIKTAWRVTGGVALLVLRHCIGPETGTAGTSANQVVTVARDLVTAQPYGTDGGGTWGVIQETFLVETTTAGTAGTLTLQWAQNTANVTGTNVTVGTHMEVTEVDLG